MTLQEALDILQKESNEEHDTKDLTALGQVREFIKAEREIRLQREGEITRLHLELGHKAICQCGGENKFVDDNKWGVECSNKECYLQNPKNEEPPKFHWEENREYMVLDEADNVWHHANKAVFYSMEQVDKCIESAQNNKQDSPKGKLRIVELKSC